MRVIDCNSLPAVPWKNGGGSTRTVAVSPEGAGFESFDWRISIADVRESGDFSLFPGVDRTILLLDGNGMTLDIGGSIHALTTAFEPFSLPGDVPVSACLVEGAARDFNVMVRRGRAESRVQVWQAAAMLEGLRGDAVFYCSRGAFAVSAKSSGDVELAAGRAVRASGVSEALIAPAAPDAVLIGVFLV